MGFKPERKVIPLRFAVGDDLHGLEIDVLSLSYGEAQDLLADGFVSDDDFIDRVQSWNLESDMGTLPIETASLKALDAADIRRIKITWFKVCSGTVPDFLEQKSQTGDSPEVASLPMESL